jgi:transposase
MMGRLKSDQGQLFYEFHLGDAVPEDHLVRKIDAALDLSWLRSELAPHYSSIGRPSIDPELMIRMLVVGYVFAIRSERLICREVQVNLATSPIAGSANSASKMPSRTIQRSRAPATSVSEREMFFAMYSSVSSKRALRPVWLEAKALRLMRA